MAPVCTASAYFCLRVFLLPCVLKILSEYTAFITFLFKDDLFLLEEAAMFIKAFETYIYPPKIWRQHMHYSVITLIKHNKLIPLANEPKVYIWCSLLSCNSHLTSESSSHTTIENLGLINI